jgi:hypothetical protein
VTRSDLLSAVALLQQLAEQSRLAGTFSAHDKVTWNDLERQLLLNLRTEERAASPAGADPLREPKALGSNEHIRNLVWEVSVSIDLQSPREGALLELAELLRARADAQPEQPRLHPAA